VSKPARRRSLLVVDDEVELMRALCESLGEAGFEVRALSDPTGAPNALREGEFDLLLSDLMMPGTDGIQLQRASRSSSTRTWSGSS
jgi:DNA-binding response OmpR family regulator